MLAIRAALAIAALSLSSAVTAAVPAPRVSAGMNGLRQPLPLPYDEAADADRQVARAKARARAEGKKLLIDLGGNWCADCRVLAGVMALPEVGAFLRQHYVVVYIDVGRLDKNAQVARAYGVPKVTGVPALLVVDPRDRPLAECRADLRARRRSEHDFPGVGRLAGAVGVIQTTKRIQELGLAPPLQRLDHRALLRIVEHRPVGDLFQRAFAAQAEFALGIETADAGAGRFNGTHWRPL